jgi:hypothetical protein
MEPLAKLLQLLDIASSRREPARKLKQDAAELAGRSEWC